MHTDSVEVAKAAPGMGQTLANKLGAGNFYREQRPNHQMQGISRQQTVRNMLEQTL